MPNLLSFIPREPERRWTHVVLALLTAVGCYLIYLWRPDLSWFHSLTISLGYAALIFTAATLLIGPLKLLSQRRNPVNINLRRDLGIWAGLTGCLHVVLGFQVHMSGNILRFFFVPKPDGTLQPMLNLFGLSNDVGLAATLILVVLLLISDDLSVRLLKGPLWKWIQRSNYVLILLVLVHTFGYQAIVQRAPIFTLFTFGLTLMILILQGGGVVISLARRRSAVRGN